MKLVKGSGKPRLGVFYEENEDMQNKKLERRPVFENINKPYLS